MLRLVLGNILLILVSSQTGWLHISSEETVLMKATTGEVFQHRKAIGVKRSIEKVVSIVGCNLRCLQDELCEATNFLMGLEGNYCELLAARQIAGISFVSQENATFSRLKRITSEIGEGNKNQEKVLACDEGYSMETNTKTCFAIETTPMTWSGSIEECHRKSGWLAKISSHIQLAFIRIMTSQKHFHFGIKKDKHSKVFWSDGTAVPPSVVASLSINQVGEMKEEGLCGGLVMLSSNVYNAQFEDGCFEDKPFICQQQPHFI